MLKRYSSVFLLASCVVVVVGCGEKDGGGSTYAGKEASKLIRADEGGVFEALGAKLEIKAEALTEDVEITLAVKSSTAYQARDTIAGEIYDFGPDGLVFWEEATLTLPLPAGGVPAGGKAQIVHNDSTGWEVLRDSEVVGDKVRTSGVGSFSEFAVDIFSPQEVEGTVACKDVEMPAFTPCGGELPQGKLELKSLTQIVANCWEPNPYRDNFNDDGEPLYTPPEDECQGQQHWWFIRNDKDETRMEADFAVGDKDSWGLRGWDDASDMIFNIYPPSCPGYEQCLRNDFNGEVPDANFQVPDGMCIDGTERWGTTSVSDHSLGGDIVTSGTEIRFYRDLLGGETYEDFEIEKEGEYCVEGNKVTMRLTSYPDEEYFWIFEFKD